ncbi:MAG: InlB B-repeat-containing protein [Paludibacteraceae bacterium]|nr:InlB B-repeat-containing protein [Paludibacteraceae bacterium]
MKKFFLVGLISLVGFATLSAQGMYDLFGYGKSATGGGNATPILVDTEQELIDALSGSKSNRVVIITANITVTTQFTSKGSNITLLALPGKCLISNGQSSSASGILNMRGSNIIIRNVTFVGPGAYDCDGKDLLQFEDATNAWVDHCDFQDGCDGNFDIKSNGDNITITWCRFRYLKPAKSGGSGGAADHRFANLLGQSSSAKPADGTYNVTYAHNWWDNGCKERMVRCRNCEIHFFNCYWNSDVANYYVGPENAKCYFEGCTFAGKANSKDKIFKSYGGTNACKFVNSVGNLPSNQGTVNNPSYRYFIESASDAVANIKDPNCGAGATLVVETDGTIQTCGATLNKYVVTFNLNGKGTNFTQEVYENRTITAPANPTTTGFVFDGWYTNQACTSAFDFSTPIAANTTLYAKWVQALTVTFDLNGHGDSFTQEVVSGAEATKPSTPVSAGYVFVGWYSDQACTNEYVFNTPVTSAKTIYAKWEESNNCYEFTLANKGTAPAAGDVILGTGVGGTMTMIGGTIVYSSNGLEFKSSGSSKVSVTLLTEMQVGTVITLNMYNGSTTERGLKLADATGDVVGTYTQDGVGDFSASYIVTENDGLAGKSTFQLHRSNNTFLKSITVSNCGGLSCSNPELAYATTSIAKTDQDASFTNTLTNPHGLVLTYSSSNTNVATIASNGEVTIKGPGSTIITASAEAQGDYCAATVTYTLTVSATGGAAYPIDETDFPNPERGFYEHAEWSWSSEGDYSDNLGTGYFTRAAAANRSLLLRIYYLDTDELRQNKQLPNGFITMFNNDMQKIRNNGMKCILRFAYDKDTDEDGDEDYNDFEDASPATWETHLAQLKPYLQANADVIYVVQAGFLGVWGEWYYSSLGTGDEIEWSYRQNLIDQLLDAVPANRCVQLRTPLFKKKYLGNNNPLTSAAAYHGSDQARLGHHNDAFLNGEENQGTYENRTADMAYIAQECLYVPIGGETNLDNGKSDIYNTWCKGSIAEAEMAQLHYSYLNHSYSEYVTDQWKTEGAYARISRNMGYRFQLLSASFDDQVVAGTSMNVQLNIKNVGYAPLYNERYAYIVLKNNTNTYSIPLSSDPRTWAPNNATTAINEYITLPATMVPGTYDLYLYLPDASASIAANPKYAVRFANKDIWQASTGYNILNKQVVVTVAACSGANGTGSTFTAPGNTYMQNASAESMSITGVTASNGGALTYQWYKTTSDIAHGEVIDGATESTYTPSTAEPHAAWYYYCVVAETGCPVVYTTALSGAIVVNAATYTITYNTNGADSATPTQEAVTEGTTIVLAAPASKANNIFVGWFCNVDDNVYKAGDVYTMTAANTTFTAQWQELGEGCFVVNSTTLGSSTTLADGTQVALGDNCTADANGLSVGSNMLFTAPAGRYFESFSFVATCGSDGKTNKYKINNGSEQKLASSTKAEQTYTIAIPAGTNASTIQIIKSGTTPKVSQICYTFKTEVVIPTYIVSYDANGGSCATASENASSVALPTPTRDGYTFNGWYTAATGGTLVGAAGDSYAPSADITLYAQWTANAVEPEPTPTIEAYATYYLTDLTQNDLTYEKTGLSDNDQKLNTGCRKVEVPCANASGVLYLSGTSAKSDRYASIYGSHGTVYDESRQIEMTKGYGATGISFNANDIFEESGKYFILFGSADDYKISAFKYTLNSSCSATPDPDCTNPVVTTQPADKAILVGEATLLACAADKGSYQWYNATDNTAAGTGATGTMVNAGAGYNAGGWTTPIFATAGTYSYYCIITDDECSVQTNTVTVTVSSASLPTYTVTYDANGGSCSTTSENASSVALPTPTRDGYTFNGWYTAATGGTLVGAAGDSYAPSADITLYAQWTENAVEPAPGECITLVQGSKNADNTAMDATIGTIVSNGGQGSEDYIKLSGDGTDAKNHFKLTAKAGYAIKAGDILTVTVYNKSKSTVAVGFKIGSTSHTANIPAKAEGDVVYTLQAGDIVDGKVTIIRASSDDRYKSILLERCTPKLCTPPAAPTALTATAVGKASATLTITDDETPASYDIYYSTNNTAPDATTVASTTTTNKTITLTSLTHTTTYYAWVRAVCDESNKSEWIALTGEFFTTVKAYTGNYYNYIIGSAKVENGDWIPGQDGKFGIWKYTNTDIGPTLVATTDITCSTTPSGGSGYYNTKDIALVDDPSQWSTGQNSTRTLRMFKVEGNATVEFDLGSLLADKIAFYSYPGSNDPYSVSFYTNQGTETKQIEKNSKEEWYSLHLDEGPYVGKFGITNEVKSSLYAVVVYIPEVNITYNANGGSGYMDSETAPCGGKINLSLNKFHKPGMLFGGWTLSADGTGEVIADGAQFTTTKDVTLYAKWIEPCEAEPTLKLYNSNITVWDGEKVDLTLASVICNFDTTGIKYTYSITPAAIPGCRYEFFDSQFHIMGIPTVGNTTAKTYTLTLTLTNDCPDPVSVQAVQNITVLPKDQKARIALILTGTEGGEFNQYDTDDATACADLIDYLNDFYSITCVNGYATKNEAEIANYYKDYDLLIVTDFLNTGLGYTNAIGTLIDKKPILSFEAYVAGENGSNWHIGSNPVSPEKKVQKMKILCAGHAIFGNDTYNGEAITVVQPDTTVEVLSSLSGESEAKGLQGFTINEAPDFLFLATIRDTKYNRDLIVCCERQVVFTGRLMIYGINSYEMGNLSRAGKIIMRQMIDYLLLTDETALADCALVFDNGGKEKPAGSGDHLWSNPKNWAPGRNIVPTPYHPTRIIAECHVDIEDAHAGSVKINRGVTATGDSLTGRIIVKPDGGLTVAGFVYRVNDIRYAVPLQTVEDDILIQANATHNGALVYGNKDSDVHATVEYYSKGEGSSTANPVWQYMGIPLQADKTAISMYYKAWMCRWNTATTDNLGGLWQWVENEDVLEPFEGYCITQEAAKTYTLAGRLNPPVTQRIILNNRDADGYAFAANSWTAPIKIQEMLDEDFTNAEKSIYIYYTGSYKEWQEGQPDIKDTIVTKRGQYGVVPIRSAPYVAGADSVIPAMQGFFIKTTAPAAYVDLVYNRVVYDSKYFKTSTEPMRVAARDAKPEVLKVELKGPRSGDQFYMLIRPDFNEQFVDGWDGRKIEGDPNMPMLAVIKECGNMAVAAVETASNHYLSFRAGKDSTYTFSFEYDSDQPLYLYDQLTEKSTEIKTGNTYTFEATNNEPTQRFLITDTPREIPTSITLVETENSLYFENYANQLVNVRIVDMQGRVIYACNTTDEIVHIQPYLPLGVYLAHITMGNDSKVVRLIGKEDKR